MGLLKRLSRTLGGFAYADENRQGEVVANHRTHYISQADQDRRRRKEERRMWRDCFLTAVATVAFNIAAYCVKHSLCDDYAMVWELLTLGAGVLLAARDLVNRQPGTKPDMKVQLFRVGTCAITALCLCRRTALVLDVLVAFFMMSAFIVYGYAYLSVPAPAVFVTWTVHFGLWWRLFFNVFVDFLNWCCGSLLHAHWVVAHVFYASLSIVSILYGLMFGALWCYYLTFYLPPSVTNWLARFLYAH